MSPSELNGVYFRLISVTAEMPDIEVDSQSLPFVIGRSVQTDARIPDPLVSRRQCELSEVDGLIWIRDLETTNGTMLNGDFISYSPVQHGDMVMLGGTDYLAEYAAQPVLSETVDQWERSSFVG